MNDNVTRLEPHTLALFWSIDDLPKIDVKLCSKKSLTAAICLLVWSDEEAAQHSAELLASGHIEFEDGFLHLCVGLQDVVAYLMQRLTAAHEDSRAEDEQRAAEYQARVAAEAKYRALQAALIEALGDKTPGLVAIAAADLLAQGAAR